MAADAAKDVTMATPNWQRASFVYIVYIIGAVNHERRIVCSEDVPGRRRGVLCEGRVKKIMPKCV